MSELCVNISEPKKSYPIIISNSDISNLRENILNFTGNKNYIVVISSKVYNLYSKQLNFPKENLFILKDGEQEKNIKNYYKILDFALRKKLTREDFIIAIGGGVVGDLAGLAASTYMRGIGYIQVPTTLLACTDSSVGGKTAINTPYGKNLIGSFYQPKAVFINPNFLKTLDEKQFKSGLGEVIKYGFIEKSCECDEDLNLINFLNANYKRILARDILILQELIEICIKLKISVVQKDEKESGLRKILNYGHTYGHAIEKLTGFKKYTHGECVAEGIIHALRMAQKLCLIDKEYKYLCDDLISKFGYKPMQKFNNRLILQAIKIDKKAEADSISYVLPTAYAQVEVKKITLEELKNILGE